MNTYHLNTAADWPDAPMPLFFDWFEHAKSENVPEAEAMTLCSCTASGKPSARTVLLRGLDERGFRFYTNYESRKSQELISNPNAALLFYWREVYRQVRIEGTVEKVAPEDSDAYFNARPRANQVSAVVSKQSQPIEDFRDLMNASDELLAIDEPVPRPDHWGGFLIRPKVMEFWAGTQNKTASAMRLFHDRLKCMVPRTNRPMTHVEENPYEVHIDLVQDPEAEFGWTADGELVDRIDSLTLPKICYDTGLTIDLVRRVQTLRHHAKSTWLTHGLLYLGAAMHALAFAIGRDWLRGPASMCAFTGMIATLALRKTVKVTSFEHRTVKREREHRQQVVYSMFALAIPLSVLLILNQPVYGAILTVVSVGGIATYDNYRFKLRHLKAKPMPNGAYAISGFSDEFHEVRRQLEAADGSQ